MGDMFNAAYPLKREYGLKFFVRMVYHRGGVLLTAEERHDNLADRPQ